jgi:ABC-type nitrate/sulfonate/bicarbonate transport system substrate-binding protein
MAVPTRSRGATPDPTTAPDRPPPRLSRRALLGAATGLMATLALPRAARAQAPIPVRVGLTPVTSAAAVYIGVDRGYFADEGLDVSLIPFDSGPQMIPLLGTGQLEVGSGAVNAGLFNAVLRGIPLRMVAAQSVNTPGHGSVILSVRKDLLDSGTVRDYADLRGRRIGLSSFASANEQLLDVALGLGGLTVQDVDVTLIPLPEMTAALANGSLDAAVQVEPTATAAVELGVAVRWRTADQLYPNMMTSTWVYSPAFATQQPEAAQRFMLGLLRGTRDYLNAVDRGADREAVIQTLIRHTPVKDRGLYERMILPGLAPDLAIDADALQNDILWYVQRGHITEPLRAADTVTAQFVEYALARLGRYQ